MPRSPPIALPPASLADSYVTISKEIQLAFINTAAAVSRTTASLSTRTLSAHKKATRITRGERMTRLTRRTRRVQKGFKKTAAPHRLAPTRGASQPQNPPRVTHRLLKAHVSHGDDTAVSPFTARYSAAVQAAPLQTELRTTGSAELRVSARVEKKRAHDAQRIFCSQLRISESNYKSEDIFITEDYDGRHERKAWSFFGQFACF